MPFDFLSSPLLAGVAGLTHGFGLRMSGTRAEARAEATLALRDCGDVFFLNQIHGNAVVRAPWTQPPEADASLADEPGMLLAIETADCLPLLLVDPIGRRVAAAHAGWRGTRARVAPLAVRALEAEGSNPPDLLVALGPAIGPCCYEVGPDVEEAFGSGGARFFSHGKESRKHFDLVSANRAQLEEAGVRPDHIDVLNLCTRCREDLFFSYRRDGTGAGRMISVVGFSGSSPRA